jgi:hypothetical protein
MEDLSQDGLLSILRSNRAPSSPNSPPAPPKWRVPLLSEMFPRNPSLLGLNINGGQEIRLRLRPARGGGAAFYGEHHILMTMLHELTHIVHGEARPPAAGTKNRMLRSLFGPNTRLTRQHSLPAHRVVA